MKLKLLAIAFAASFALTACDSSSTSSDANEPVSENSNPGQDQQTTEVKKDSTSSESSVDKGKTSTDTKDNEETAKTSNGSNINLEGIGMTQEQYNLDMSKNYADVVCEGELTDNFWKIKMTGTFAGTEFLMKGDVTFEGDSMITNRTMEMDWGTEGTCKAYMNTEDEEDDEETFDKELYGDVVESVERCEGSRMVQVEKLVKKNVTDESRTLVYKEMVGKCKDYRDGKITYEELMMD